MPHPTLQIIKPKRGTKKFSIGHLRQAIKDLPDDMLMGPDWETDDTPDHWPQIGFRHLAIQTFDDGKRLAIVIRGIPLAGQE